MDSRMKTADAAIYLLRCMVHNETPDEKVLDQIDMDELFKFGEFHKINACLGYALRNSHVDNRWSEAMNKAIYRTMMFDNERKKITDFMDENGIWYCCLKGVVLQHYYPEYGIREFSDNDILFDPEYRNLVKAYMIDHGYDVGHFGVGHDDTYEKKPFYNFEMHVKLFDPVNGDDICDYYKKVDSILHKEKGCEYVFSPEDFFVYFIMHALKHYESGGTGLRTLMDIFYYLHHNSLDYKYISNQFILMKNQDIASTMIKLSVNLFSDISIDEKQKEMLYYITSSGAYGTMKNRTEKAIEEKGEKYKYVISRLFPDRRVIETAYPYAINRKYLYPIVFLHRLVRAAFGSRKRVLTEIKTLLQRNVTEK